MFIMQIRKLLAPAIFAAVALGASPAPAAILTGIWFGEQDCDRFDGHKFNTKYANDVMVITQIGNQINMAALFHEGGFNLFLQGTVINDDKKPGREGEAAFTACPTSPTSQYQETGRATKVSVRANGFGDFDATSIFLQIGTDEFPTDTGTCHWHYKRAYTVDPGVPDCASLPSQTLSTTTTGSGFREPRRP
jgi:hypothetical protein